MPQRNIRQQSPPNLVGKPSVEFRGGDFDALIHQKGYDVIYEQALRCPCQTGGSNRSDCQNCKGFGWIFINPVKTRMVLQSLNSGAKYKSWSAEYMGKIKISASVKDRLSFMDRITLVNDYSEESEVRTVKIDPTDNSLFIFPSFEVKEVIEIFKFISSGQPLERIDISKFTVNKYAIRFNSNSGINSGDVITIRYKFNTQYQVLDIPNETRSSLRVDSNGRDSKVKLPIHAIAQRVHTIQDRPDLDGGNIIHNDYL